MNEKETHILPEQIPVEEFQPIDIFQEPPKKRRLMRRISGHKRWKKAEKPKIAAAEDSPFVAPMRRAPEEYQEIRRAPAKEESPLTEADAANALYFHAVGGLLVSGWVFAWLARLIPQAVRWPARASAIVFHLLILAFPVIRRAVRSDDQAAGMRFVRPAGGALWLSALCGLGASLCGLGITLLWGRGMAGLGAYVPAGTQVAWRELPIVLISGAVLPAICEELFFRGYLLSAWEERWGWRSVPVCAVLFALLHGSVQGFPAQLAAGMLLGCICIRSGSVFCAIAAHLGYNLGVVLLSALWQSSGWLQEAGVALCGAALAGVFFVLVRIVSGRKTVNLPSRRGAGWEGALALYAAVITALVRYLINWTQLFGGV